jgi:hypothetical protein
MTDTESKVVAAWREAAVDLGIRFTSPFIVESGDGNRRKHLGLIHHFGRRLGTVISVLDEPSERVSHPACGDYYWSVLGSGYGQYVRESFIATLDDWQFFGPADERPIWYTGKSWT